MGWRIFTAESNMVEQCQWRPKPSVQGKGREIQFKRQKGKGSTATDNIFIVETWVSSEWVYLSMKSPQLKLCMFYDLNIIWQLES